MSSIYSDTNYAIVERCKKGEKEAFFELYNLYAKAMYNISVRIVMHKEEAEDVLQESFLSAFQNIQKFDAKFTFGIWLKRIVINKSIDFLKKKKIVLALIDEADFMEEEVSEEEVVYDVEIVKNCIEELPHGYRVIISLYLFEEYNHKEIAETLGISEGTSKSQYSRARKKLMELLKTKTYSHVR